MQQRKFGTKKVNYTLHLARSFISDLFMNTCTPHFLLHSVVTVSPHKHKEIGEVGLWVGPLSLLLSVIKLHSSPARGLHAHQSSGLDETLAYSPAPQGP